MNVSFIPSPDVAVALNTLLDILERLGDGLLQNGAILGKS